MGRANKGRPLSQSHKEATSKAVRRATKGMAMSQLHEEAISRDKKDVAMSQSHEQKAMRGKGKAANLSKPRAGKIPPHPHTQHADVVPASSAAPRAQHRDATDPRGPRPGARAAAAQAGLAARLLPGWRQGWRQVMQRRQARGMQGQHQEGPGGLQQGEHPQRRQGRGSPSQHQEGPGGSHQGEARWRGTGGAGATPAAPQGRGSTRLDEEGPGGEAALNRNEVAAALAGGLARGCARVQR